jgi:Nif-specific regulatory protein
VRDGPSEALESVARERDFYLRLLRLGAADEIEPLLREALSLIVEATGALQGYVEIRDPARDDEPPFWLAHDCTSDELESIRSRISRGVIAASLAEGVTVETTSALLDERFRERASVQLGHIEAVLCAPIAAAMPIGVVYLHGHRREQAFPPQVRAQVELLASQLAPLADRLLARHREARERDRTRAVRGTLRAESVVGRSDAIATALRQVALFAPLDVPVLFHGPPGSGRRLLARVLHENGARAGKPLVECACQDLSEAALFDDDGAIARTAGGSLLLRDVESLASGAQARLVAWLDGRDADARDADVRLLVTADDPKGAVRDGRLRDDLRQRLYTLSVRVPSLAERPGDLAPLARWLCERSSERRRAGCTGLSVTAVREIETHEWPGNVAELEARIDAAVENAAADGVRTVESRHLFPQRRAGTSPGGAAMTFQEATREFQRQLVARALEETHWNVAAAARRLDLARAHLYNLIRGFDLRRNRP